MIFRNTVDSILSGIHKSISRLEELEQKKLNEAADLHIKAAELETESKHAEMEATRAKVAATNLKKLIGFIGA